MSNKTKKFNQRDSKAPAYLTIEIKDDKGNVFGTLTADPKEFSTGSVGFYCGEKLTSKLNREARYQVGMNITLIGSKPDPDAKK